MHRHRHHHHHYRAGRSWVGDEIMREFEPGLDSPQSWYPGRRERRVCFLPTEFSVLHSTLRYTTIPLRTAGHHRQKQSCSAVSRSCHPNVYDVERALYYVSEYAVLYVVPHSSALLYDPFSCGGEGLTTDLSIDNPRGSSQVLNPYDEKDNNSLP